MRIVPRTTLMIVVLSGLFVLSTRADAPPLMNFQGVLLDASGDPVTTTVDVVFAIYPSDEVGAEPVWAEERPVTPDAAGRIDVLLGEVVPLTEEVFEGPDRWLGIQIERDPEVTPRSRLATYPYGFRVKTVDGATGGDIFGDLHLHSTMTVGDLLGDVGRVELTNGSSVTMIADGPGGTSGGSRLLLFEREGATTVNVDGDFFGAGLLTVNNTSGSKAVALDGLTGRVDILDPNTSNFMLLYSNAPGSHGSQISMFDGNSSETVTLTADITGSGGGALLTMADGSTPRLMLDGRGFLSTTDASSNPTVFLGGSGAEGGGLLILNTANSTLAGATLDGYDGNSGRFSLRKPANVVTVEIDADDGDGGPLFTMTNGSNTTIEMDGTDGETRGGKFRLFAANGDLRVSIQATKTLTSGSQITLRSTNGTPTVILDSEFGVTGIGKITTGVIQITGGADLSEQFEINSNNGHSQPAPGMVVCIDPEHPGELAVSTEAYSRTVAGVISGAGGVSPGLIMGQVGSLAHGGYPVALTGRVYCSADASSGPIRPGDLLTTSDTPGHAMKVNEYDLARGAIIGKAMTSLDEGRGLVLVLVSLQ